MRLRVGCEFQFETSGPTPALWQVRVRPDGPTPLSTTWSTDPPMPSTAHVDGFGNLCDRLLLSSGSPEVRYDAVVDVPASFDAADDDAAQVPVELLSRDVIVFLLPSRFCLSDALNDKAWELFGDTPEGWERVQAVCDWTHQNVRYEADTSTPLTTAAEILDNGAGVCRDFSHVAITFCRALNIPARYVSGYMPDLDESPNPDDPMDFCSWFEAYLDGRWWTFDPRNNGRRIGRVTIGWGRDAADVAMVTTFGDAQLQSMAVWADEVG
jgi:transglutaminase-like putative cysteine protease